MREKTTMKEDQLKEEAKEELLIVTEDKEITKKDMNKNETTVTEERMKESKEVSAVLLVKTDTVTVMKTDD